MEPGKIPCWACSQPLDPGDKFCRHCGAGQGENITWYYKPWGIIVLTVALLGPFTLPFAYKSPLFSPRGRMIAMLLIVAFSAYQVWACWRFWEQFKATGALGSALFPAGAF